MKSKNLTSERLRELLSYSEETGLFTWRINRQGHAKAGDVAGNMGRHYWYIGVDGSYISAHRLAWLYVHGEWPEGEIDHIDQDKTNNRISNLRDVSRAVNVQNTTARKGYTITDGRYVVDILANGKRYSIGSYKTEEEAKNAYLSAKRVLHEDCPINAAPPSDEDFRVLPNTDGRIRTNTSGHTGVSFKKSRGRYEAHIRKDGKYKYVGHFKTISEAVDAREKALKLLGMTDKRCEGCKHKEHKEVPKK